MFFYLYKLSHQLINAQTDSRQDTLTHLYNRRALDEQLPLLLRQSQREQSPLSVLFIDIDHFRLLNERYGHESGDVALQAVAKALASVCQRPRDFICRWGGEEFVAVLPHTDVQAAEELAQRMLQTVRDLHLQVAGHSPPKLTVSIGHISTTVTPRNQDKDLIGAADQAMLLAKHRGRNQSVMATTSRTQRADNLHVNQDDHP
jgi:diguanylate cyclase (GGDEF)-like protein